MLEIASQITLCLLVAAFIGFFIGYLVAKNTTQPTLTDNTKTDTAKEEVPETVIKTENPEVAETEIQNIEEEEVSDQSQTESQEEEKVSIETEPETAIETKAETGNVKEEETEIETETESSETEEVEIPTDQAVENALAALKELEEEELKKEETAAEEAKPLMEEPELLSAPNGDQKDDLTKIKGIGPKVEEKLNEAGIYHFYQIANWTDENIRWLEKHTAFAHRATKDLWALQAKALNKSS